MSLRLIQDGPKDTRIVVVGEAPGETEQATGVPFAGASGVLINQLLSEVGINRASCFVTNVAHIRPQGSKSNDFAWFFQKAGLPYLFHGITQLKADLEEIKPNLVIALGGMALRALTGKVGIDKWRGSILECILVPGLKVIATYHPSFSFRVYPARAVIKFDLLRCAKQAQSPDIRLPERTIYCPQNITWHRAPSTNNQWIRSDTPYDRAFLIEQMLHAPWLGQDIEASEREGGGWKTSCCGFSDQPHRALVLDAHDANSRYEISRLSACAAQKVMQNGQFDFDTLRSDQIEVRGYGEHIRDEHGLRAVLGWDTMLAQHTLMLESAQGSDEQSSLLKTKKVSPLKKGLGFITSICTDEPFYKDDGKLLEQGGDIAVHWRYNGLDSCVQREIKDVQAMDIQAYGVTDAFLHKMARIRTLDRTTDRGIPVDIRAREELKEQINSELETLQAFLDGGAGRPINVLSNGINGDIGKLLYEQLGLPMKVNKKTGRPTADKDAINELAAKHAHPLLLTILGIRQRRKIRETYLDARLDSDGRMRPSYNAAGTNTNRLSSGPNNRGTGQNIQNQPLRVRESFISLPGFIACEADYSQAEARVVAYLAREQSLIDLFSDSSRDVHTENAARIYGVHPSEVSFERRYASKRIIHSYNYGLGADKGAAIVNQEAKDTWGRKGTGITVSTRDAQFIIDNISAMYPGIRNTFWQDVITQLKRDRTLTGVFGSKRTFFDRWETTSESNLLNSAISFVPQNAVGELTVMAMIEIDDLLPDVMIVANVHDALWFMLPDDPDTIESSIEQIAKLMHIPLIVHGKTFYIPSEFLIGSNFGKAGKDGSNPQGLMDAHKWLDKRRQGVLSVGG